MPRLYVPQLGKAVDFADGMSEEEMRAEATALVSANQQPSFQGTTDKEDTPPDFAAENQKLSQDFAQEHNAAMNLRESQGYDEDPPWLNSARSAWQGAMGARASGARVIGEGLSWLSKLGGMEGAEYDFLRGENADDMQRQARIKKMATDDPNFDFENSFLGWQGNIPDTARALLQESGPTLAMAAASAPLGGIAPAAGWLGAVSKAPVWAQAALRVAPFSVAMRGMEGAVEGGEVADEMKRRGRSASDVQAAAFKTVAANIPLAALDVVQAGAFLSMLPSPAKKALSKVSREYIGQIPMSVLTKIATLGATTTSEGLEETVQEEIQNWAVGAGFDPKVVYNPVYAAKKHPAAFNLGALTGLTMGGANVAVDTVIRAGMDQMDPEQAAEIFRDPATAEENKRIMDAMRAAQEEAFKANTDPDVAETSVALTNIDPMTEEEFSQVDNQLLDGYLGLSPEDHAAEAAQQASAGEMDAPAVQTWRARLYMEEQEQQSTMASVRTKNAALKEKQEAKKAAREAKKAEAIDKANKQAREDFDQQYGQYIAQQQVEQKTLEDVGATGTIVDDDNAIDLDQLAPDSAAGIMSSMDAAATKDEVFRIADAVDRRGNLSNEIRNHASQVAKNLPTQAELDAAPAPQFAAEDEQNVPVGDTQEIGAVGSTQEKQAEDVDSVIPPATPEAQAEIDFDPQQAVADEESPFVMDRVRDELKWADEVWATKDGAAFRYGDTKGRVRAADFVDQKKAKQAAKKHRVTGPFTVPALFEQDARTGDITITLSRGYDFNTRANKQSLSHEAFHAAKRLGVLSDAEVASVFQPYWRQALKESGVKVKMSAREALGADPKQVLSDNITVSDMLQLTEEKVADNYGNWAPKHGKVLGKIWQWIKNLAQVAIQDVKEIPGKQAAYEKLRSGEGVEKAPAKPAKQVVNNDQLINTNKQGQNEGMSAEDKQAEKDYQETVKPGLNKKEIKNLARKAEKNKKKLDRADSALAQVRSKVPDVEAAIWTPTKTFRAQTHFMAYDQAMEEGNQDIFGEFGKDWIDGFVFPDGSFYNRDETMERIGIATSEELRAVKAGKTAESAYETTAEENPEVTDDDIDALASLSAQIRYTPEQLRRAQAKSEAEAQEMFGDEQGRPRAVFTRQRMLRHLGVDQRDLPGTYLAERERLLEEANNVAQEELLAQVRSVKVLSPLKKFLSKAHPLMFDENGDPILLFHGTFANIEEIDLKKVYPGGYIGRAFYTTTDPADASENYADEETANLSARRRGVVRDMEYEIQEALVQDIKPSKVAEMIANDHGFTLTAADKKFVKKLDAPINIDMDMFEDHWDAIGDDQFMRDSLNAEALAEWAGTKIAVNDGGARIYMMVMSAENPLVLGASENNSDQTYFEYSIDPTTGEPSGSLNDFVRALEDISIGSTDATVADAVVEEFVDRIAESISYVGKEIEDGVSARTIYNALSETDSLYDVRLEQSSPGEEVSPGEIFRQVIDKMGYDAVIMDAGVFNWVKESNTKHYITWKPANVKSWSAPAPTKESTNIAAQVKPIKNREMFKIWFKGSKAVDPDGEPLRLFHGTVLAGEDFEFFDPEMSIGGEPGDGIYLATNPDVANRYAPNIKGGAVYEVYLSIKNPFLYDEVHSGQDAKRILDAVKLISKNSPLLDIAPDAVEKLGEKFTGRQLSKTIGSMAMTPVLEEAGYDGVMHRAADWVGNPAEPGADTGDYGNTWVAFYPQQVKSINNEVWSPQAKEMLGQVRLARDVPPGMSLDEFNAAMAADPRLHLKNWYAEREIRVHYAAVEGRKLQKRIAEVAGQKNWARQYKYGQKARDLSKAIHVWIDLQAEPTAYNRFYDQLSNYQKEIVDLAMNEVANSPELLAIADEIRREYDKAGQEAMSSGLIHNMRDNYVNRVWRLNGKSASESGRAFGTTTRHRRKRVLPTILQGWADGLDMAAEDAVENLVIYKEEVARAMVNKELINYLRMAKADPADPDSPYVFTHINPGAYNYKELKHPNMKYWVFDGFKNKGIIEEEPTTPNYKVVGNKMSFRKFAVYKPGAKVASRVLKTWDEAIQFIADKNDPSLEIHERWESLRSERLYAPAQLADHLNKITEEGYQGDKIRTLLRWNARIKSTILLTSLFHHMAFARSFWLGTTGKPLSASGEKISKIRILKAYQEGMRMIDAHNADVETLIRAGLTLGRLQDWDEIILQDKNRFSKWMDNHGRVSRQIKNLASELRQRQTTFLFKNFGAGLKVQAALIELAHNREKFAGKLTDEQIAEYSAEIINQDFGGLNWDRMGVGKKRQQIMRTLLLAPDWTGSNFLTIKRLAQAILRKVDNPKEVRQIYQKFWAGILMKGIISTVAMNMIMAGLGNAMKGDDEEKDNAFTGSMYAFEDDWQRLLWADVDVTPLYTLWNKFTGSQDDGRRRYFSIFGHFKDPVRWAIDPMRSVIHKGSPAARVILEAIEGTDWKGDGFTTVSELFGTDQAGYYKTSGPGYKAGDPKGGQLKGKLTSRMTDAHPISYDQIPSWLITQAKGSTPVQVQEALAAVWGQKTWFDALARSLGAHMSPSRGSQFDIVATRLKEFQDEMSALKLTDPKKYAQERRDNIDKVRALMGLQGFEKRIRTLKLKITALSRNKTMSDDKKAEKKRLYEKQILEIEQQYVDRFGEFL